MLEKYWASICRSTYNQRHNQSPVHVFFLLQINQKPKASTLFPLSLSPPPVIKIFFHRINQEKLDLRKCQPKLQTSLLQSWKKLPKGERETRRRTLDLFYFDRIFVGQNIDWEFCWEDSMFATCPRRKRGNEEFIKILEETIKCTLLSIEMIHYFNLGLLFFKI